MENIKVDKDEFAKQYAEEAGKNGMVCEIFIQSVEPGDFEKENGESLSTPLCQIRGKGTAVNLAILAKTMRRFADHLEEDEDIKAAVAFLDLCTRRGRTIDVLEDEDDKD